MTTLSPGLSPNHMQCTPGNQDESLIKMILYKIHTYNTNNEYLQAYLHLKYIFRR